jgi:hypothetical protein
MILNSHKFFCLLDATGFATASLLTGMLRQGARVAKAAVCVINPNVPLKSPTLKEVVKKLGYVFMMEELVLHNRGGRRDIFYKVLNNGGFETLEEGITALIADLGKDNKIDTQTFTKHLLNIEVAIAFAHYSWVWSQGKFLICDIQGSIMFWTDLQVLSEEPNTFGSGNIGTPNIVKFFEHHKCNALCYLLSLDDKKYDYYK